ncbi:MAG: Zn-ribbon domain-containing OB-fold protein [Thermodesulfobacteriota bacterium]|nr:Zn-ribbon domain-containing OB-fold protein [Thermodesulfobacteriota bacterium]
MSPMLDDVELLVAKRDMRRVYRSAAGRAGTRFLKSLKDDKKILGVKCKVCDEVFVPPTSTCVKCFSRLDEWVELSGLGTVHSFTVVHSQEPYQPVQIPFVYAIIRLEGADTGLTHILGEIDDLDKIEIGMQVEAVFKTERNGHILDIEYFRPV